MSDFTGQDLLGLLTPSEDTYEIPVRDGVVLKCRMLRDMREMEGIKRKSRSLAALTAGTAPAEWRPYLPIAAVEGDVIAGMSAMVIEPVLSDLLLLQMCREAGPATFVLYQQMMAKVAGPLVEGETEALDLAKNV